MPTNYSLPDDACAAGLGSVQIADALQYVMLMMSAVATAVAVASYTPQCSSKPVMSLLRFVQQALGTGLFLEACLPVW